MAGLPLSRLECPQENTRRAGLVVLGLAQWRVAVSLGTQGGGFPAAASSPCAPLQSWLKAVSPNIW